MKMKKLLKKFKIYIPRGIDVTFPFFVKHAKNSTIFTTNGRQFIDFTSGISAVNLGHMNKKVIQAIKAQAEKFIHTAFRNSHKTPFLLRL